jgi:hypothetical protein
MQLAEAIAAFRQSLELVPDPNLEQYIHTVEQQLALQQRRETAQRLRNEGSALEHDRKIREAIGKYQESLRYVPDKNLEAYIAALEKALQPTPQPTPQPQPVPVARVDVTGSWRHHAEGTWTITRTSSGGWFAQESGLGNASGPGHWTAAGTFRIDYVTRDGAIKGYYDIGFAPDGRSGNGTVRELNGPMRTGNSHWERLGVAPTATDTASVPAPTGKPNVVFDNGNIGGVDNKPTRATTFSISQTRTITKIVDYHWNNGRGTSQTGSIALRDAQGRTWGPWRTSGTPGQGGVPNAYWTATPNVQLPPGNYTVIDSDPATWAQNSGSQGAGHTRIEGH